MPEIRPTEQTYHELQMAFDFFNKELFNDRLPQCIITLQRQQKFRGFFAQERFINGQGDRVDELALNPGYFATSSMLEIMSTIVHEQTHSYICHFGNAGRRGYHNREWADHMESIGLIPSDTGRPGGKKTGERMSHYIVEEGLFAQVCSRLLTDNYVLSWMDRIPHPVSEISDDSLAFISTVRSTDDLPSESLCDDYPRSDGSNSPKMDNESIKNTVNQDDERSSEETNALDEADTEEINDDILSGYLPSEELSKGPDKETINTAVTESISIDEPQKDVEHLKNPVEDRPLPDKVQALRDKGLEIELVQPSTEKPKKNKSNREKYTCPQCSTNIWGKPGIKVYCGQCSDSENLVEFEC